MRFEALLVERAAVSESEGGGESSGGKS